MEIDSSFKPGEVIENRYRIDRLLGRGGFGEVYEAFDTEYERPVALKFIFRKLDLTKLRNEVKILARHARRLEFIPDVYADWQSKPVGTGYFIVMEYIEGLTLDNVEDLPWPHDRVVHFLRTMLAYLVRLHSQQPSIIHRDIKPANIKLAPPDNTHVPYYLLDFGLAKQGEVTVNAGHTPAYAAPEQYVRSRVHLGTDHRADLYSLAATTYFLLTNERPVSAETRSDNLRHGIVDPLRVRLRPSSLVPGVSEALEETLLELLNLDRNLRPSSAAEALGRLEARLTGKRLSDAPPPDDQKAISPESPVPEPTGRSLETDPGSTERASSIDRSSRPISIPPKPIDIVSPLRSVASEEDRAEAHVSPDLTERGFAVDMPFVPNQPPEPSVAALAAAPQDSNFTPSKDLSHGMASLQLLDAYGNGRITSMVWASAGHELIIGSALGIYSVSVSDGTCRTVQATTTPVRCTCHLGGETLLIVDEDSVRCLALDGSEATVTLPESLRILSRQSKLLAHEKIVVLLDKGVLRVYDLDREGEIAAWRLSDKLVGQTIALSPDGSMLVVGDDDQLWCYSLDADHSRHQYAVQGVPQPLLQLDVSARGTAVAGIGVSALALWVPSENRLRVITHQPSRFVQVALSADGQLVAVATDERVCLRRFSDGKVLLELDGAMGAHIRYLGFSPNDLRLAAASDEAIWIWNLQHEMLERQISFSPGVQFLAVPSEEQRLVALGQSLQCWSVDDDRLVPRQMLAKNVDAARAVAVVPGSASIAIVSDRELTLINQQDGHVEHRWRAPAAQTQSLCATEEQRILVVTLQGIDAFNIDSDGTPMRLQIEGVEEADHSVIAARGGRVALHSEGKVVVLAADDGAELCAFQPGQGEITAIALSADGRTLAVAEEHLLSTWRIGTGKVWPAGRQDLPDTPTAQLLAFAADGTALVSLHGAIVHLWRVGGDSLDHLGEGNGHTERISDAVLLENNTRLVTASRDGTLRLWQLPSQ